MSLNLRRILRLPRHTDNTPTPLSATVVSFNDPSYVQPPPLQVQLAVIQGQLGTLAIGTAPEQAHNQVALESEEDDEEVELELEEPQQ